MMQQQMEALQKLVAESRQREEKSEMEQLKLTKFADQYDIEAFLTTFKRMMDRKEQIGIQVGTPPDWESSEGVCSDAECRSQ